MLDKVDCCDPSSRVVPSGPVVTTDVTEPAAADVTCVIMLADAVVVMPLSIMSAVGSQAECVIDRECIE